MQPNCKNSITILSDCKHAKKNKKAKKIDLNIYHTFGPNDPKIALSGQ